MKRCELILASASGARAALLRAAGYDFRQIPSTVAEPDRPAGVSFEDHLVLLARTKAAAVAARFPHAIVLGADTALLLDGTVLGKAAAAGEARRMLQRLTGRTHHLSTAICVIGPVRNGPRRILTGIDTVRVTLRAWPPRRIARYVKTVDPVHCAGAYALQEGGSAAIAKIEGDPATVVGLPIGLVDRLLARVARRPE